jgi:inorganic pyrophosphatase
MHDVLQALEPNPEVLIEISRGSVVKRRSDGRIDFISPVPCPYNYGCIPSRLSGDGDPLDALVLGARLEKGDRVRKPVVAVVDFLDAGEADPKVVCSERPLTELDRRGLELFFTTYALAKRGLALVRGKSGETRFRGFVPEYLWRRQD